MLKCPWDENGDLLQAWERLYQAIRNLPTETFWGKIKFLKAKFRLSSQQWKHTEFLEIFLQLRADLELWPSNLWN